MCNKVLGVVALICAPFLCIDFLDNQVHSTTSWTTGLYGFIFMFGWMASVIGLYRLKATGYFPMAKAILIFQFLFLLLAQAFNIDVIIHGSINNELQTSLDPFWPVSNGFMIVTGIFVLRANQLQGWHKWIPFIAGCWLPLMLIFKVIGIENFYFAGFYSAIAWTLLAVVIYIARPFAYKKAIVRSLHRKAEARRLSMK
ncbi:MAG: hypothetical protein ACXWCZ_06875 [Flavisolibacter sp.]